MQLAIKAPKERMKFVNLINVILEPRHLGCTASTVNFEQISF